MQNPKVVPIRKIPSDFISQDEMKSLRISQEMVASLAQAVGNKAASIAERIQSGAWIESGEEEFDVALQQVRAHRAC